VWISIPAPYDENKIKSGNSERNGDDPGSNHHQQKGDQQNGQVQNAANNPQRVFPSDISNHAEDVDYDHKRHHRSYDRLDDPFIN
jgi:hypothetical protein